MDTEKLGVIYTRVSSDLQMEKGNGLASQEVICREWSERQGIKIVNVFADGGVSGKLLSREALDQMIVYLKSKNKNYTKIQYVIVDDIDRVSRDVELWRQIKRNVESTGTKILSLKMSLDNTPESVLQQNILMSMKQFERQNNARRVRDRQRARMLEGYRPLYPPMGYKHKEDSSKRKILYLVQPHASIIKEVLELFAVGMFVTKEDLRQYLNQQSFGTRRSGKTTRSFIDRLLDERVLLFYAGYIDYKPWDVNMVEAKHPAIISKDLVYKILEKLNPKEYYKKYTYSQIDKQMPLRSVIVCESCGYPLTGGPSTNRHGTVYFYYSCRQKGCDMYGKSFGAPKVHQEFEAYLQSLTILPSAIALLKDVSKSVADGKISLLSSNTNQIRKKIRELDKTIIQAEERVFSTDDPNLIPFYEKKLAELLAKKKELEYSLEANKSTANVPAESLFDDVRPLLEHPYNIRKDCDTELKRLFVRVLFNNKMSFGKNRGIGTSAIPLIYADLGSKDPSNSHLVEMMGFEPMSKRHKYRCLPQ